MSKIKILQIIDHLEIGGAQESMTNCVTSSDADKFDMHVCSLYGGNNYYKDRLSGYPVYTLSKSKYDIKKIVSGMFRLIKKNDYDVIHLHLYFSNLFARIISGIFFNGKMKIVVHKHNNLDTDFGKYPIFPLIVLLEKVLFSFTDMVLCCSDFVRDYYINRLGFTSDKCMTFYNGIDLEHLRSETDGLPEHINEVLNKKTEGALVFGFLARLNYKKAADYLIEAFSRFLEAAAINRKHILLIAGYGKEKDRLENLVKDLDLTNNVFFVGKTENNKKTFFDRIDCFVQPSMYETFGITLLEAMFLKKPVLASKTGGIPEVLKNGEYGVLFKGKDVGSLMDALVSFVKNREMNVEQLNNTVQKAHGFVTDNFTLESLAVRLSDIYSDITENSDREYSGSDIIHIIDHMRLGGAQKQLRIVTTGMQKQGFRQKVICLSGMNQELIYILRKEGVQVYDLNINLINFPYKIRRLFRIIKTEKPEILHAMLFYSEIFSRIIGKILKVEHIVSNMRTRYLGKNIFQDIFLFLTRNIVSDHIFNSDQVYRFIKKQNTHSIKNVKVIFNAMGESVGMKNSASREKICDYYNIDPQKVIVCTGGRMVYQKGFDVLIRAVKIVAENGYGLKVIIMGSGQEERHLKWMSRRLGVERNIIFAGELSDVSDVLKGSDFFVFSTRFEGMPNIVMEAMSAGLPVVSTMADGTVELIADGVNGILTESTPKSIAQGMIDMTVQRDKWDQYGKNNARKMKEKFSNEIMVNSYIEYFNGMIEKHGKPKI